MIRWYDIYKVISAMTPLYVALILGYGSLKWWRIFAREQCDAINRFVYYFILPFYILEFTSSVDPYHLNYKFIGADAISKGITITVLVIGAFSYSFHTRGTKSSAAFDWSITIYSLCTLPNTLIIGLPLTTAMYNSTDIIIQSTTVQAIIWQTVLLFVLEFRKSRNEESKSLEDISLEERTVDQTQTNATYANVSTNQRHSCWYLLMAVPLKLAKNPNFIACIIGVVWATLSKRWHFELPIIIEGSIRIMSNAGSCTAMFSMGLFMALQEKLIACGLKLTVLAMVLRFIAAPTAIAIGALATGLHGNVLRITIIQCCRLRAMPQAIISFVYAKAYELHANVLSTAVAFGTLVSLPVLIAYYGIAESIH